LSPIPRPRALVPGIVPGIVAACAVAGTLTALMLSSGLSSGAVAAPTPARPSNAVASQPLTATLPPAPAAGGVVVTRADGSRVRCPHGAEPRITLTGAQFEPALTHGTSFVPGRYRIRLVGTVDDETGAAVDVRAVRLTLGGRPWSAKPVVATRVAPDSSARLVVEGEYVAHTKGRVDLRAELAWRWTDSKLSACGSRGLIEDD
jgi:hypothetical protein